MKTIIMILLAALSVNLATGQTKMKTTNDITIYSKPNKAFGIQTAVVTGSSIDLGTKTGDFWQVNFKEKVRYMPDDFRKYCIPIDSVVPKYPANASGGLPIDQLTGKITYTGIIKIDTIGTTTRIWTVS